MKSYFDCWFQAASDLFRQALAGEPELVESPSAPLGGGSFGFDMTLSGDERGRFTLALERTILDTPLVGEGIDQKAGWAELLREIGEAAAGELLASTGKKCRVEKFEPLTSEFQPTAAFHLRAGDRSWTIQVSDQLRAEVAPGKSAAADKSEAAERVAAADSFPGAGAEAPKPGFELLLDVELEASLRFGCREMPLGEILELGPGDVVQLDRHVSDPVDLIVGDKIVARGDVVLVNGNFGLRVTEVAAPRSRLETIRCLF
jgi:flagellar motor switch protein FliN